MTEGRHGRGRVGRAGTEGGMTAAGPCIRTEGLTKLYGRSVGIDGLDLEVGRGEVFGFLGPNGAGKTTTIRLLLDLIRPTSGRAEILGLDTRRDSLAVRRLVGYLPGEIALYGDLTGLELLTYLASLRGGVGEGVIRELAERLDVELDRAIADLSKGNRQKVGLIQAFMHEPQLLILDEPTAGLDPLVQQEFYAMARETRERGATVFLSSHILREVQETADRAAFIRAGRLVAIEDVDSLRRRSLRHVHVVFADAVSPASFNVVPGVRSVNIGPDQRSTAFVVEGDADAFVKALARHHVLSLVSEEADLEDVFMAHYRDGAGAAA